MVLTFSHGQKRWLLAGLLPAILAGCQPEHPPEVQLKNIAQVGPHPTGLKMRVTLEIRNPNGTPLRYRVEEVTIFSGKREFSQGVVTAPFDIPAHASRTFVVPVSRLFLRPASGEAQSAFPPFSRSRPSGGARYEAPYGKTYHILGYFVTEGVLPKRVPFRIDGVELPTPPSAGVP